MPKYLNQIINTDSIAGLSKLPDNYVHLILSDIPYGIGVEDWDVLHANTNSAYMGSSPGQIRAGQFLKSEGNRSMAGLRPIKISPSNIMNGVPLGQKEWLRVIKPGGSVFIFAGRRFSHRCIAALEDSGFSFKDMFAWMRQSAPHRAQRVSAVYERR